MTITDFNKNQAYFDLYFEQDIDNVFFDIESNNTTLDNLEKDIKFFDTQLLEDFYRNISPNIKGQFSEEIKKVEECLAHTFIIFEAKKGANSKKILETDITLLANRFNDFKNFFEDFLKEAKELGKADASMDCLRTILTQSYQKLSSFLETNPNFYDFRPFEKIIETNLGGKQKNLRTCRKVLIQGKLRLESLHIECVEQAQLKKGSFQNVTSLDEYRRKLERFGGSIENLGSIPISELVNDVAINEIRRLDTFEINGKKALIPCSLLKDLSRINSIVVNSVEAYSIKNATTSLDKSAEIYIALIRDYLHTEKNNKLKKNLMKLLSQASLVTVCYKLAEKFNTDSVSNTLCTALPCAQNGYKVTIKTSATNDKIYLTMESLFQVFAQYTLGAKEERETLGYFKVDQVMTLYKNELTSKRFKNSTSEIYISKPCRSLEEAEKCLLPKRSLLWSYLGY